MVRRCAAACRLLTTCAVLKHELASTLQNLLLEQSRLDKEHENPATVSRFKETADVPIILGLDTSARKHRHTTKNLYQTRGTSAPFAVEVGQFLTKPEANAVVADIRDAIQGPNHAVVGVDLHPAAWNAITASQTWITNDGAWRTLLDETPQLQKEVGVQLREYINTKRSGGASLVFLFSLRDEKLFLHHLQ